MDSLTDKYLDFLTYTPKETWLFVKAATHPGQNKERNYERLEFLGDAVLDTVVAYYLFMQNPKKDEGNLTKQRRVVVNGEALKYIADKLKLFDIVKDYNPNVSDEQLKNCEDNFFEAIIGAIFLDAGFEKVYEWIDKKVLQHKQLLEDLHKLFRDFKSELIRLTQKSQHKLTFLVEPTSDGKAIRSIILMDDKNVLAEATGRNRKAAERIASRIALEKLKATNI